MDIGSQLQKEEMKILFCDINGWWDKLERMFMSNSGLVSRNPESCLEEIISYYCPQCLNRYMEDEVNGYQNRCPNCFTCPICECIVSDDNSNNINEKYEDDRRIFKCNYCSWKGGIVSDVEKLQKEAFQELLFSYQEEDALLRNPKRVHTHLRKQQRDHEGSWRCADIEEAITNKTSESLRNINPRNNSVLYKYIDKTVGDYHNNNILTWKEPGIAKGVALRTKRTLRSRKDFDEGKMSILVQPKAFPLEGDSSMNLQRGRWFIKDTSAFYSIPRLEVINNYASNTSNTNDFNENEILCLHISNPLEDDILLRFESRNGTTWGGKVNEDGDISDKGNHQYLANLRISNGKKVKRATISNSTSSLPSFTPPISLKGYEDPLLRDNMGGCVHDQDLIDFGDGFQMKQYENEAIIIVPLEAIDANSVDQSTAVTPIVEDMDSRYLISVGLSMKMKVDGEEGEWTTYEVMMLT